MDKSLMDLCNESEKYLARTPEQAGERQRVLEGLAKAVAEERTAGKRLRELEFQYGRKWLESQQVADILNEAENKHNAAIQAVSDALEVKRG